MGWTVAVATSPVRPAELTWLVGSTTAWVVARWAMGRMEAVWTDSRGVTLCGVMWA